MPADHGVHPPSPVAFWASLTTTTLSLAASGIIAMALPWYLISGGYGTSWAGVASFAIQLPVALALALGGYFTDVYGSRRVLVWSNVAALTGVGLATIVAFVTPGALPAVVCFLALANFLGAPGNVAQDARVPELAGMAGLPLARANGLRDIAATIGQILGPASSVLLVSIFGLSITLAIVVVILALIAIMDAVFFPSFPVVPKEGDAARPSGLDVLRKDRLLAGVISIGLVLVAAFTSLDEIVAPALAVESGLSAVRVSLFLALTGIASVSGAIAFTWVGHRYSHHRIFVGGVVLSAIGFAALAALPPAWSFCVAPVLVGLGVGPLSPIISTAIQLRVAVETRGSVIGLFSSVIVFSQPVAALLTGPTVDIVGVNWVTIGLSVAVGIVSVIATVLPALRILDGNTRKPARPGEVS
jgi:MFS family permease